MPTAIVRCLAVLACITPVAPAHADWYYYVMKVVCTANELRVLDYSAYNEEGAQRRFETGAIDVDKLSTWRRTENDLNVPDKPRPHVTVCKIPSGRYRVTLTNAGGGYSAPFPVINVHEISNPNQQKVLIHNLALTDSHEYQRIELVFSTAYPRGRIIKERPGEGSSEPTTSEGGFECRYDGVQQEMNACAVRDYRAADAALNEAYKQLMPTLSTQDQQRLRQEQRTWLRKRDPQCKEEAKDSEGGSMWQLVFFSCLESMTRRRTDELVQWR
jgi:uncharacterized protein YecT (DUF1311 family)